MSNVFVQSAIWNCNKNPFSWLLTLPTTTQRLKCNLTKLGNRYFPVPTKVKDVTLVKLCLNDVALKKAKSKDEQCAQSHHAKMQSKQNALAKRLDGVILPGDGKTTRCDEIARIVTQCTQGAKGDWLSLAKQYVDLTSKELRYLQDVLDLYALKLYATAYCDLARGGKLGKNALCQLLGYKWEHEKTPNVNYNYAYYASGQLGCLCNCLGSSVLQIDGKTLPFGIEVRLNANGKNVFDNFTNCAFGKNVAHYLAKSNTLQVDMQRHVAPWGEVRNFTFCNKSQSKKNFCLQLYVSGSTTLPPRVENDKMTVVSGNLQCIAYVNGCKTQSKEDVLQATFTLEGCQSKQIDVVCCCGDAQSVKCNLFQSQAIGSLLPKALWDEPNYTHATNATVTTQMHGYTTLLPPREKKMHFVYNLGNNDVATFCDNDGNGATLLDGFVWGVGGESVWQIDGGKMTKVNGGKHCLNGNVLHYYSNKSSCNVWHDSVKHVDVNYYKPCKTLVFLPLASKSQVTRHGNAFTVTDEKRRYTVSFNVNVQCYTTNDLQCNAYKLRYALDDDLTTGKVLAVCLQSASNLQLQIVNDKPCAPSQPLVRESLVSTYLNYVNDKNVFCLRNHLNKADALTVASICYTNAQFVKQWLTNYCNDGQSWFYDERGKLQSYRDDNLLALVGTYYQLLVGKLDDNVTRQVNNALFSDVDDKKNLCVRALALSKASNLQGVDKVKALVLYSKYKTEIDKDERLSSFAQAIGAIPLKRCDKTTLRNLCKDCNLPKCWYYVSQLENLYGLFWCQGRLKVLPSAQEDELEQMALCLNGKKLLTTFVKGKDNKMTINGNDCWVGLAPNQLEREENQLVVHY